MKFSEIFFCITDSHDEKHFITWVGRKSIQVVELKIFNVKQNMKAFSPFFS